LAEKLIQYVVKTSDGTLYGFFYSTFTATEWADAHAEEVGDYTVEEVHLAE
jgi:hypothetical protein